MIALGLLAAGAIVTLRVESTAGVEPSTARAIAEELGREITERTGLESNIAKAQEPKRPGAEEVVSLSFFGGLTKVRLVARRVSPTPGMSFQIDLDVPKDPAARADAVREAAARIYPERKRAAEGEAPLFQPTQADVRPEKSTLPAWLIGGSGIALLAGGVAFGAASVRARHSLATDTLDSPDVKILDDRMRTDGLIGGILIAAGVGAVVAGALLAFDR